MEMQGGGKKKGFFLWHFVGITPNRNAGTYTIWGGRSSVMGKKIYKNKTKKHLAVREALSFLHDMHGVYAG
jgi:hypothetical protein